MKPRAPNATPSAESIGGATPGAPENPHTRGTGLLNAKLPAVPDARLPAGMTVCSEPECALCVPGWLTVPTLIMCSRREPDNRFEQSRLLAALIPKSRLVPLDSSNRLLPERDPAWRHFLAEIDRFLPGSG